MRIRHEELVLGGKIGGGSQGAIYRAKPNPAFGLPFPLIYKEFSANTVVAGLSLELLAQFRADLDEKDRAVVDLRTVWPAAVVEKAGRVCGYVMQEIPDTFMQTIHTTSGSEPIPREVQHLFVADALARKNIGEIPKRTERFALARETAFIFGFLHKREWIFGDFSYKNAVYTLRPQPMVMLLDCDAVRRRGQGAAVPQLNSPGWGAPEKGPQTIESDRYKLGLFILRCLTPGVNAQNRDPEKAAAVLDAEGLRLLRLALGADPAARPSGKDWVVYLDAHIAASGGVRHRTQPAAAPAPPPKIAQRASSGGRRTTVVSGPRARRTAAAPAPATRRAPAVGSASTAPPPWLTGGFGTAPGSSWVRKSSTFGGSFVGTGGTVLRVVIQIVFMVVIGVALFAVVIGSTRRATTPGPPPTTARSVTTTATRPSDWPTATKALAQSANDAVALATRTAGAGWEPSGFTSSAERTSPDAPSRPVWRVDLVDPSRNDGRTVPRRTYRIDADGNVTLVQNTVQVLPPSGTVAAMGPYWPVALGAALDLVATPTRQSGPILVRHGCSTDDPPACGWELR